MLFLYNYSMKFEWNPHKSELNYNKHGVSLEQAKWLWVVPHVEIKARTQDEPRYMIIGRLKGKLYSCVYTTRNGAIRLISARRSRKSEENIYYEYIQTKEN